MNDFQFRIGEILLLRSSEYDYGDEVVVVNRWRLTTGRYHARHSTNMYEVRFTDKNNLNWAYSEDEIIEMTIESVDESADQAVDTAWQQEGF